ncbi:hypothetical protein PVL29_021398 [Vitis rotundifolia]|uniref:SLH domain-containing protein n=2 Tax=Vitis rotundifolia TaxID=103349 RepID=A0AA38YZQ1_VITRO|nr:hypothetical protein PVL29_021398 [Vitis rotundifolia]
MASVTTNWSPSSFQLRFSFQCRRSPAVLVRTRVRKLDRQVRVFSVAGDGNGVGRHRDGNSWNSSESKGDDLSGWSGSDGSEQHGKSQKKRWPGGMVGAGVAGVVLVAGLSFAAFSLSKQNPSRPEKQMEAMTIQMEQGILQEDYSLESKTGTDAMPTPSIQEDMSDASLAVGSSESSQLEENEDALKLVNSSIHDADTTNLNSDDQGGLLGSKGTENSNFSLESSSSSFPRTVDEDHYVHSDKLLNEWKSIPNKSFVDANGTQHPVSDKEYLDLDELQKDVPNKSYVKLRDLNASGIQDPVSDREFFDLDKLQKDIPNKSYVKLRDLNASGIQDPVSDREHLDLEELQDIPNKSYEKLHDLNADREYLGLEELEKGIPNKSYVKLRDLNASGIQHSAPDEEYLDLDELQKDIPNESYVKLRDLNADREYLDLEELEKDIPNKSYVKLHDLNASGIQHSVPDGEYLDLDELQKDIPNKSYVKLRDLNASGSTSSMSALPYPFDYDQDVNLQTKIQRNRSFLESSIAENSFSSAGIPAPSAVSESLKVLPGQVVVPAVVDQVQGQALAALQVLKVIEPDVQPSDLCTRREFARWLVSASSVLSRNTVSKVYPAMYIDNITELAFDDITPEDPDFSSIQGLAEAGLISSKLSRRDLLSFSDEEDQSPFYFSPDSPLSRQDLVSWKMALEKRQLPETEKKVLYQVSGFIDIDNINPDAWPALVADASAGEQGIIALAFGYTRLFQPNKPVTKAQAAIALATGESSDIVSEELARIEAEAMAEKAVAEHSALVDQVEKELNASFEKELSLEREKIDAMEKLAEEARQELEKLRAERNEDNISLIKERAAIESEMEVLIRLRHEVEEQLQSFMSNKVEIAYEKERISKLRKEAESENQEIARLQYELEVERKALSMARAWAEDEAKRAREQAKALEEARDRWEKHGIKVVVDNELREEASAEVTWLDTAKQFSVDGTVIRAENLVDKLNAMGSDLRGKSKDVIDNIVQKIIHLISILRELASKVGTQVTELKDAAVVKAGGSIQELQQNTAEFGLVIKEGTKRVVGDCREGVEKLTQKFKI